MAIISNGLGPVARHVVRWFRNIKATDNESKEPNTSS